MKWSVWKGHHPFLMACILIKVQPTIQTICCFNYVFHGLFGTSVTGAPKVPDRPFYRTCGFNMLSALKKVTPIIKRSVGLSAQAVSRISVHNVVYFLCRVKLYKIADRSNLVFNC